MVQVPDIAVFLPAKRNASGQAVVICPGGGYGILAYEWEGIEVAKWLNAKGIAAIVLKYRLPNAKSNITPHLTPLLDAKRAMRLVGQTQLPGTSKRTRLALWDFLQAVTWPLPC
jgi:acetyl esterase/lipase